MLARAIRRGVPWLMVAVMLLPETASAVTTTYPTSITAHRKPTGVVERGTAVHIYGKLSSEKRVCIRNSTIKLIRVGTGVIRTTKTGRRGRYAFDIRVRKTARYRVRFPGKTVNVVHPNTIVCEASSTGFRIRVR
jgi:hypothetical protein